VQQHDAQLMAGRNSYSTDIQKPVGSKGKFVDFFKWVFYKPAILVSLWCEILAGSPHFRPSDTCHFKHNQVLFKTSGAVGPSASLHRFFNG